MDAKKQSDTVDETRPLEDAVFVHNSLKSFEKPYIDSGGAVWRDRRFSIT